MNRVEERLQNEMNEAFEFGIHEAKWNAAKAEGYDTA